ncbi:unnamed protein product [Linum tenue]|uniref:Uncharacterized protein n=1 Tax=Linum tenue TaxID=586396 RepID=A0AAV0R6R9_9ROSI|nr:unnamed protein product [Linum tenue]CAI0553375.1 unnamed protein product [Linum tenue]
MAPFIRTQALLQLGV